MNLTGKLLRINEDYMFYHHHMQTEGDFELFSGGLLLTVLDDGVKNDVRVLTVLSRFGIGLVCHQVSKTIKYEVIA